MNQNKYSLSILVEYLFFIIITNRPKANDLFFSLKIVLEIIKFKLRQAVKLSVAKIKTCMMVFD